MPYDTALADNIRKALPRLPLNEGEVLAEKKMFGGLCFTLNGKMLMGVDKTAVMIRLDSAELEADLAAGRVRPMDFTGRPMANFAYLNVEDCQSEDVLLSWATKSLQFVRKHMLSEDGKPAKKRK